MKNYIIYFGLTLFIMSCGGNNAQMQKDAKNFAELSYKYLELKNQVEAGDISKKGELSKAKTNFELQAAVLETKYGKDNKKFIEIESEELLKLTNGSNNESKVGTGLNNESKETMPKQTEINTSNGALESQVKDILKNYQFLNISDNYKFLVFEDKTFKFIVLNGYKVNVCSAQGTYKIIASNDGSIAKIILIQDGPIQKSPIYEDSRGVDTELFLRFNSELLLQKPTAESLSKVNPLTLDLNKLPDYLLMGRDAFEGNRQKNQAEKDSIANEERKKEEKKREIEEKLKGL